jgi:hypothetical protein
MAADRLIAIQNGGVPRNRNFGDPTGSRGHCGNVGEAGGRGQERWVGRNPGCGGCRPGVSGRASGGVGQPERSGAPARIEIILRHGLRLGGIKLGRLVEVVGEGLLGGLLCFPTDASQVELGLGRPPGGVDQRGRSGLTDVGRDLCNGLRIGQERDEREGGLAGWTDLGEDFIDPGRKRGPTGRPGGGGGGVGRSGCWRLCLGRRSRGGCGCSWTMR